MKAIITIEGGNVQSVFTDVDCDVEVIDFDTEKIPKDKLTRIPDRIVGSKEAFVYTWSPQETNPGRVKELMETIGKEYKDPTIYLMFGEEACREYVNYDFEVFAEEVEQSNLQFILYKYNGDIYDMLSKMDGWNEYVVLNKNEYEKLSEL